MVFKTCINITFSVILVFGILEAVAKFIGYALCAADEALRDAEWLPTEEEEKERTVKCFSYDDETLLFKIFFSDFGNSGISGSLYWWWNRKYK